jgi:hypothetical protein
LLCKSVPLTYSSHLSQCSQSFNAADILDILPLYVRE